LSRSPHSLTFPLVVLPLARPPPEPPPPGGWACRLAVTRFTGPGPVPLVSPVYVLILLATDDDGGGRGSGGGGGGGGVGKGLLTYKHFIGAAADDRYSVPRSAMMFESFCSRFRSFI
jgi:hypothetical protein